MAVVKAGVRFLGLAMLASVLVACGEQEVPLENFTAEEIYKQGELALTNERRPDGAIRYFQEVERLYP